MWILTVKAALQCGFGLQVAVSFRKGRLHTCPDASSFARSPRSSKAQH